MNYYHIPSHCKYDPLNIEENAENMKRYILNRTNKMFKWHNLPEYIPIDIVELWLQTGGHLIFTTYQGDYIFLFGGWGGEPNAYYLPTQYIVANPYLPLNERFIIGNDCVLVKNDSLVQGLSPLIDKYTYLMAQNELTMYRHNINTRALALITVDDNNNKSVATEFSKRLENGKDSFCVTSSFAPELISVNPLHTANRAGDLQGLIEYQQYIKAELFQQLGIDMAFNMKREKLNAAEVGLNTDYISPLVDDMLSCRQHAADEINKMFGLDISVEFAGVWQENQIEDEITLEQAAGGGENDNVENTITGDTVEE